MRVLQLNLSKHCPSVANAQFWFLLEPFPVYSILCQAWELKETQFQGTKVENLVHMGSDNLALNGMSSRI
jgi:hypothetical protein